MSTRSISFYCESDSSHESKPKDCSTILGRTFTRITQTICSVAKVSALVGVLFAPIAHAYQTPGFRPYISRFVHPGLQMARNGTMACDIQPVIESAKVCEINADKIFGYIQANRPAELQIPLTHNGYPQEHESGRTFFYNINPRVHQNYIAAVGFVKDTLFGPQSPLEVSPAETVKYILELHDKLVRGLPNESELRPGAFRKSPRYFGSEYKLPEYKEKAKLLPKKELALFESYLKKLENQGLISLDSPEELDIWKKVGMRVAPCHTTIESQIKAFATRIFELREEGINGIDLAAYIHTEIARITPFIIANGQVARLLTNAALVRYAKSLPVVFSSKRDYLHMVDQAVTKQDYRIFALYLRTIEMPWTAKMQPQLRAVESQYPTAFAENTALYMKPGFLISPKGNVLCPMSEMEAVCTKVGDGYLQRYKDALSYVVKRILQNPLAFTEVVTILADIRSLYAILAGQEADFRTEAAEEMVQFANTLQLRLENETQFVEIACWAHTELTRIAPFAKHTGKLARIILTALLRRYTPYNHIFFANESEYHRLTNLALHGDLAPFIAYVFRNQ